MEYLDTVSICVHRMNSPSRVPLPQPHQACRRQHQQARVLCCQQTHRAETANGSIKIHNITDLMFAREVSCLCSPPNFHSSQRAENGREWLPSTSTLAETHGPRKFGLLR